MCRVRHFPLRYRHKVGKRKYETQHFSPQGASGDGVAPCESSILDSTSVALSGGGSARLKSYSVFNCKATGGNFHKNLNSKF